MLKINLGALVNFGGGQAVRQGFSSLDSLGNYYVAQADPNSGNPPTSAS